MRHDETGDESIGADVRERNREAPRPECLQASVPSGGSLQISPAILGSLSSSLGHAAGPRAAELAFFRAGREWGRAEAERSPHRDALPSAHAERGLAALEGLGLGRAAVAELQLGEDGPELRVACRITPFAPRAEGPEAAPGPGAEALAQLSAGFLTGWLEAVTGSDLACSVAGGEADGGPASYAVTIEPARTRSEQTSAAHPAVHSSRFFLDSLGGSLGELDLSLADLLENTQDAIIFLDTQNVVRFWNHGAQKMFQYEREEVLGEELSFLVPSDLRRSGELQWLKDTCERNGAILLHPTRRIRRDGAPVWVNLTRTLLHDRLGRVIGAAATLRDVSDQKGREEELQRARFLAMVGELAANIAHEVKNPLAGIRAALQVLEDDLPPADPRREVFASIGEEVLRLNDITQDLLSFARPPEPLLADVDLAEFFRDLVEHLGRNPVVGRHAIELEIEPGLAIALDAGLTVQVFSNLVLNAAQAMLEAGRIRIRARAAGETVAIEVRDTGPGIPDDVRESLFDPFFTTKARGSGLGLSIAKKNMEVQGGSIHLESSLEPGARFRLEFPARPCAGDSSRPA